MKLTHLNIRNFLGARHIDVALDAARGDMDGSKVWPMVRDGHIADVAEYCKGDVERSRELHRRMTFAAT